MKRPKNKKSRREREAAQQQRQHVPKKKVSSMQTMTKAMQDICGSISRNNASFAVTQSPPNNPLSTKPFALLAGAHKMIEVPNGFIVSMGLSRTQLEQLRDTCNELLGPSN